MRRIGLFLLWLLLVLPVGNWAGEYKLLNGDVVRGEALSFDETGFIVKLDIGGFSSRINWSQLTQQTLKELAQQPEAKRFAEPFIEIPPQVKAQERAKKRQVVLKEVPRVERLLPEKGKTWAMFTTPAGLSILLVLFLANLYAAYEVALYRQRSPALVCGVSAVLPVIGPILFLSAPSTEAAYSEGMPIAETEEAPAAPATAEPSAGAAGGLSLASLGAGPATNLAAGMVFKRGDTTFNRRFFEVKFPGFFRIVSSEAEKDLVLVIRSARGEFVAKRISRISMNEIHVQTLRGGTEAGIPFTEITEVLVRHKDAKN